MRFKQILITFPFTVFLFSCQSSSRIKGSWEFVGAFEGDIKSYHEFKNERKPVQNQGRLIFNSNSSFLSINDTKENHTGIYFVEKNVLKLKYSENQNYTEMKINSVNKNFLFLFTDSGKPFTWCYKKVKD